MKFSVAECLWTNLLWVKVTDVKDRWQEGTELQMPKARPQPGLHTASRCLRRGEKGLSPSSWVTHCASIRFCKKAVCFYAAGSLHLVDPYQRKRAPTSFFVPVRNRNGFRPGCWWYMAIGVRYWELSTVPEMGGRVQWVGVKRINSLPCLDTTTGNQRALSSTFVTPSAITFLFLAINVLVFWL